MVVVQVQVMRGWKQIARFLNCSVGHARKLHKKHGLPLVDEGGTWTLTTDEYLRWRKGIKKGGHAGPPLQS